jgi:hypothetical protein
MSLLQRKASFCGGGAKGFATNRAASGGVQGFRGQRPRVRVHKWSVRQNRQTAPAGVPGAPGALAPPPHPSPLLMRPDSWHAWCFSQARSLNHQRNTAIMTTIPVVRVGVAAVVRDAQGCMVMGIRRGQHGEGWRFLLSFVFSRVSLVSLCSLACCFFSLASFPRMLTSFLSFPIPFFFSFSFLFFFIFPLPSFPFSPFSPCSSPFSSFSSFSSSSSPFPCRCGLKDPARRRRCISQPLN